MLNTLKRRFILTAIGSVTVLLVILLGALNVVNVYLSNAQSEQLLDLLLSDEHAALPNAQPPAIKPEAPHRREPRPDSLLSPPLTEDTAMSARFFRVFLDADGAVSFADLSRISTVTEEDAAALTADVLRKGDTAGRLSRFHYRLLALPDGRGSMVVFLDVSAQRFAVWRTALISCAIGLLVWLIVLGVVLLMARRAIAPIAQSMERQKQFVTNAGHEIKTPLAIISTNVDALELHQGGSCWSENIRAQVLRLDGLMRNLLALARLDESALPPSAADFSLSLLCEELLDGFNEQAAERRLTLTSDIAPDLTVHADRGMMAELITLLLDNAAKYADPDTAVTLSLCADERQTRLTVRNRCAEIPQGDLDRLFDRFVRGNAARTQKSGGYGIGLSIARALAEANRARLTVSAPADTEIAFNLIFPTRA